MKKAKKVTALALAGVLVLGTSVTSLAAGTTSKTVDGVKVTGSSSISGRTASGWTERTTLGNTTVRINYRYKVKNSMTLRDGTQYAVVGGYRSSVTVTPDDADKMYEISGTHTAALNSGSITLYT